MRLILHGKAAGRVEIRNAVTALRAAGHRVLVQVTWEGGDTLRFAQTAALDRVDTVIAGGGDGTINEVAMGMVAAQGVDRLPSLGILPEGSPLVSHGQHPPS